MAPKKLERAMNYGPLPTDSRSEMPLDQYNHALAALRYLVSRVDSGFLARFRRRSNPQWISTELGGVNAQGDKVAPALRTRLRLDNDELWTMHSSD
jgi:hypothetical protein